MSTILECKNLSKKYGRKQALDNITLSLESGRIIGRTSSRMYSGTCAASG